MVPPVFTGAYLEADAMHITYVFPGYAGLVCPALVVIKLGRRLTNALPKRTGIVLAAAALAAKQEKMSN